MRLVYLYKVWVFWRKFLLEIPGGAVSLSLQGRYLDGMASIGFGPRPSVTYQLSLGPILTRLGEKLKVKPHYRCFRFFSLFLISLISFFVFF